MLEVEKQGIPTVSLISRGFETNAQASAQALGLTTAMPIANVPHTFSNYSVAQIRQDIDAHIDSIISGLTQTPPKRGKKEKEPEKITFKGGDLLQAWEAMNRRFLETGWGDGFPIVPPTQAAVNRMLENTRRAADDVVAILDPGRGLATIGKIATNAVMAGCLPEHMPVLIAAVEAMADPKFELRKVATSTGPHAVLLLVSGPIAEELKINSGRGALGPGAQSHANSVIGRALRLIMMNIGQTYVGRFDMDTIGSPNKYSMCLGENVARNPWEPYHVEMGFKENASTVTVFSVESQIEVLDLRSNTAEHLLNTVACIAANPGAASVSAPFFGDRIRHNVLLLCPDHAAIIAGQGWAKSDIKEYLYHEARLPWRYLKYGSNLDAARIMPAWKWLLNAPEDLPVPVVGGPDWFHIVIVGGAAGKSSYLTGFSRPVTREIPGK